MQLSKPLAVLCLSTLFLPASFASEDKNPNFEEERNAYIIIDGKRRPKNFPDTLESYTRKLSLGGKIYFYANRRDYSRALELLNVLPNSQSGSALYVKAFCFDGLGKSADAVKLFEQANAKVGSSFKPGLKFFLQWSTAQYHAGDFVGSLKNIALAERMYVKSGARDSDRRGTVPWTMLRRKACIAEKQKKFEEAFNQYLSFFGAAKSQFHLYELLVAEPQIAARAKKWLTEHPAAPTTKEPAVLAKYSLTKGKAYIALGDFSKAKAELEKLDTYKINKNFDSDSIGARTPSSKNSKVRENTMVSINPLTKTKDEALVLLLRMYFPEKNFEKCCILIRGTFFTDPMDSFAHYFSALAMTDVPELVSTKDVSLHSKELEKRLDFGPYKVFVFDPDLKLMKQLVVKFRNDPLLAKALGEAQKRLYNQSYQTLEQYSNKYANADNSSLEDAEVTLAFRMHERYKYDLIQKSLALAAHRRDFVLPFSNDRRVGASIWTCVESHLLGTPSPVTEEQKVSVEKMPSFRYWCHFADAVNSMYKRNFKKAAQEFLSAGNQKSGDSDLSAYSKILENFCVSVK
ncbi:MAG: hypothetical protein IAF58_03400 [Leptolyngbya sp.]|nr:hypothetical protein [Candidatus Melainabacteria bacterium]